MRVLAKHIVLAAITLACLSWLVTSSAAARPRGAKKGSSESSASAAAPVAPKVADEAPAAPAAVVITEDVQPKAATPAAPVAPTPASAPAADSEPAPTKPGTEPSSARTPETRALREELTAIMDELASARARAAVLGKTLFKTRVQLKVQNLAAPDVVLDELVLELDGEPVYRADASSFRTDEARSVFEGFVAPGPHELTVVAEQRARDDAAFGYALRERYRFRASKEKTTALELVLDDGSDLADDPEDGKYEVRTRLRVSTKEPEAR